MLFKILFMVVILLCALTTSQKLTANLWPGVDKTVVERLAEEQGRKAREPIINTDQGELLLFLFLLTGSIAGYAGGYYWKTLMDQRSANNKDS